jgi:hypothetical protein
MKINRDSVYRGTVLNILRPKNTHVRNQNAESRNKSMKSAGIVCILFERMIRRIGPD